MGYDIKNHVLLLRFKLPVRYIYAQSSNTVTHKDEVVLHPHVFDSCPSIVSLVNAIEKKASRSEPIRGNPNIVPLCMVLLSSKGYSINSSCFEHIDNILIERCWENLKVISHSVELELQQWMEQTMAKRSAVAFSMLYCATSSHVSEVEYLNINVPKNTVFHSTHDDGFNMPPVMWNISDAEIHTMMLHMNMLG